MIKHIVMWKLKDENKAENAQKLKTMLESLNGVIPELVSAHVGINIFYENDSYDLCLVSSFKSLEDLQAYKIHPLHVKVSEFCKSVREKRKSCDFYYNKGDLD